MRVTLVSDTKDFEISSLNSSDQYMRPNSVARWDFYATPLRGGTRTLRILVSMRVKVESKDELIDLPSYERDVIVAVAPVHATAKFISKNWQWAAGTVLIPLLVWAATKTDAGSALLKQVVGGFSTSKSANKGVHSATPVQPPEVAVAPAAIPSAPSQSTPPLRKP